MSGPVEVGVAAAGAALIGAAVAWRATARRGARQATETALVSPVPSVRAAALRMVAAEGIGQYVAVLRQRAGLERDPEVRRLLAEVIAQSQWEPSSDEALVELRLWAHRELATEESEVAGSVRGEVVGTGRRPIEPAAVHSRAGAPPWLDRVEPTDDPAVILVTGAGGPAGVAVIRWLQAAGHRVIAVDADAGAVGLQLGDGAAVIKRSEDPRFVASIKTAARVAGATVLVPTVAEELVKLSEAEEELNSLGLETWLPDPEAVQNCVDKWRFAKVTQSAGIRTPATNLGSAADVPAPWIVKPRFGRGSRDVYSVEDEEGLALALRRVRDPIVQTRLAGREFTADALVGRDGTMGGVVPRWRLETRGGISTRGETFLDPSLIVDVAALLQALGLHGPANVQGFVDADGRTSFTEVNPRFSGGLPLSLAAGADLLGEYVRGVRRLPVRPERLSYRTGVVMLRYFEEIFEG